MPWTPQDYPAAMKNLPERVRNKAIEIANALLEDEHYAGLTQLRVRPLPLAPSP